MKKEQIYDKRQLLSKITKRGKGDPVLIFAEDLESIFSKGFIAIPNKSDIKNFQKGEKKIEWEFNSLSVSLIEVIDSKSKEKLEEQKNKLLERVKYLEIKKEGQTTGATTEKDELLKLEAFSFDWNNPQGKVYKTDTDLGIAILDWGLCNRKGEPIALPRELIECELPNGDIKKLTKEDCLDQGGKVIEEDVPLLSELIECELPNGDIKKLTKEDCLDQGGKVIEEDVPLLSELIECELPNGDIKKLTKEDCLDQGGKVIEEDVPLLSELIECELPNGDIKKLTKEDCLDQGGKVIEEDDNWWKYLGIGLGLLILVFLLKNCEPYAKISFEKKEDSILLQSYESHDSTHFFSKGIFRETNNFELQKTWTVYQTVDNDTNWVKIKSSKNDSITLDKFGDGVYKINLKVTDSGNWFKKLPKSDDDNLLYVLRSDTMRFHKYFDILEGNILVEQGTLDPLDTDEDLIPDNQDHLPFNPDESIDEDKDGVGKNSDLDDTDSTVGLSKKDAFPFNPDESIDEDSDKDGVPNGKDAFPFNPDESIDEDKDGVGKNSDIDDNDLNVGLSEKAKDEDSDKDGVPNGKDAFPFNPDESIDEDKDGVGKNSDIDDNDPKVGRRKQWYSEEIIESQLIDGWKKEEVFRKISYSGAWEKKNTYYINPKGIRQKSLPDSVKRKITK